jgi:hypothetical protein
MKRVGWSILTVALMLACGPTAAVAQSSGSFSASINSGACALNNMNGSLSGGIPNLANVTVQTPNSSQTTLLIRPSLVTGLFTNTQISKNSTTNITTSSAVAAVTVHVTMDGHPVAPDKGTGVIYDERFQQVSSNVFNQIAACSTLVAPNTCFFDLILSTLSMHSGDFVAPNVGGGTHTLGVTWDLGCFVNGSPVDCGQVLPSGSAAACVGPGVLTVEQVKNFSQNGPILVQ